jgi:hypothetical protein
LESVRVNVAVACRALTRANAFRGCGASVASWGSAKQPGGFCAGKWRAAAWKRKPGDDLALFEDQLTRALARVRVLQGLQAGT